MEYIILEYRLSSEIDFSSLTYFSCLVKKKLPAACRGRAGQRGRPCITIAPAAGRPPNLFGERDRMQEEMHYITEEMAAEFAAALSGSGGDAFPGVPPQSALPLYTRVLRPLPGHREAGGCSGPQQYRDYPHLPPDLRGRASAAAGPAGAGFMITEFTF